MTNTIYNLYSDKPVDYHSFTFHGGEPHVVLNPDEIRNQYLWIFARITSMKDFGELMVLVDAIKRCGPTRLGLFIPYFPGARQDRASPGTALTVKVYADIVNAMNLDKVVVVDPHSDVTRAVLHCEAVSAAEILKLHNAQYDALISPDAGAEKKAFDIAQTLGIKHVIFARKHRDVATGKLSGFSIDTSNWPPNKCLLVDDICDGGGTFVGLASHCIKQHAHLWYADLYVTHGIFSAGLDHLHKHFGKIITTNSLPQANEGLDVIDLFPIGNAMMRSIAR